jgi:hypothetical protein
MTYSPTPRQIWARKYIKVITNYFDRCQKRHDEFLKDMFLNDPNREKYQRKYEKELQALLEQMISQVDNKIKRSLARIELPTGGADMPNITAPEMNAYQQEAAHQRIDQLE